MSFHLEFDWCKSMAVSEGRTKADYIYNIILRTFVKLKDMKRKKNRYLVRGTKILIINFPFSVMEN